MKILYLTGCLSIGGTEYYALDCAKSMINAGNTVFWGSINNGPIKEIVASEGVNLLNCLYSRRLPVEMFLSVKKLRKCVSERGFDIIHAIDAYSALIAVLAFKGRKKRPVLVWSNVGIGSDSYRLMKKYCEPYLNQMLTTSNFIRNRMIEEGFDPEKITVFAQSREMLDCKSDRNALRKEMGVSPEDFVIGSIGRLSRLKGNITLVKAMPGILEKCKNAKLLIVGDGPDRQDLEKAVEYYGLRGKVIFAGFRTDIENVYSVFDIVAFPTYYEALGYIPFEAMYYEKPLVASLTGGIPEIVINNYNGLLVSPAVTEQWENAIIKLYSDKDLCSKLVNNGKQYYNENLAYDPYQKKLSAIYKSVLSLPKRGN